MQQVTFAGNTAYSTALSERRKYIKKVGKLTQYRHNRALKDFVSGHDAFAVGAVAVKPAMCAPRAAVQVHITFRRNSSKASIHPPT